MKILKFFGKIFSKDYLPITMGVIILLLVVFNLNTCNNLKEKKLEHERDTMMYENNLQAMNDSLVTYYNEKLEQQVSEKTAYLIKSVDDLKKYNENLFNEFKNMKNSIAGINSKVNILVDSLVDKSEIVQLDSNTYKIPWEFKYKDPGLTQNIFGRSEFKIFNNKPLPLNSYLDKSEITVGLKYSFEEKANRYKVWATSPSDRVKFDELDGVLFIDKVKPESQKINRWAFGPYAGFGLNTDLTGKNARFGWGVGVAASYNLFARRTGKKINLFKRNK